MPSGHTATGPEVVAHVAANVRRLRLRRGLTQEALAEAADVPALRVQRVERGQADVRISVLVALATALGVQITRLFRPSKPLERRSGRPPARRKRQPRG